MRRCNERARLFLDDVEVGVIHVSGWDGPWGFGHFEPAAPFARFAPAFGRWSLLMHADEGEPRLSRAASDELRDAERDIDRIHATLYLVNADEWRTITQLNIDGPLVEWREDLAAPCAPPVLAEGA